MPSRGGFRALAVLTVSAAVLVMAGPAPVSGQQSDAPGRPTNLTGNVAHDAVKLSWDAPEDSTVTGYQVLRRDRAVHALGDFQVHVDDTGSADTSYTDTDVEPEARYVYRVKARNGDTLGPQSSYFDADLPAPPLPAAPTGLTGNVTADQVSLSWDDPQDDTITGYQILRLRRGVDQLGDFNIHVDDTGSAATSYTDTDVEPEARYVYRIKARNSAGLSPQSGYFDAEVPEGGSGVTKQSPPQVAVTVSFKETSYDVTEGATATVTVVLDKAPGRDLTIELTSEYAGGASDDDVSGTVPTSVSFAGTETEKAFTFTVAADAEDEDGEGITFGFDDTNLPTAVTVGDPEETTVNFIDRAIIFSRAAMNIFEDANRSYTVRLSAAPSGDVTVAITWPANDLFSLHPTSLTFTTDDWDTEQTVNVGHAPDEDTIHESLTLTHTASGGGYNGVTADLLVNLVDESNSLTLNTESITIEEGSSAGKLIGIVANGRRRNEPVTITVTGMEGTDLHVYPTELAEDGEVRVSAPPDADTEDEQIDLWIHVDGGAFEGSPSWPVRVTVRDLGADPGPGIFVSPLDIDSQEGEPVTYNVVLTSEPTADVTITPRRPLFWLDSGPITFTPENWRQPQPITITSVDTADTGNHVTATITHTVSGGNYGANDVVAAPVVIDVTDEQFGEFYVTVSPAVVPEHGGPVVVTLRSIWHSAFPPTRVHTVALEVEASLSGGRYLTGPGTGTRRYVNLLPNASSSLDYTIRSEIVGFPPADYARPDPDQPRYEATRIFSVTIRDDDVYENNEDFAVGLQNTPGWYLPSLVDHFFDELIPGLASRVVIVDNDPSGIIIGPGSLEITEEDPDGGAYTLEMVSRPAEDVYVTIAGGEGTDLTITPGVVTFTPENWDEPKRVTVTAVADDDTVDDVVELTHSATGPTPPPNYLPRNLYDNHELGKVKVRVRETVKGINLSPSSLDLLEGDADGASYAVRLNTRPSGPVTVAISGTDDTDLTLDRSSLTFTRDNWNVPQRVKVTAAADTDGSDDMATLTHTPSGSDYATVDPATLPVTVREPRGVIIEPTVLRIVNGDLAGATYGVRLEHPPAANVTITVTKTGNPDVTAEPATLVFTPGNWDTEQRVKVVSPTRDARPDPATLSHSATGGGYEDVPIDDVRVVVAAYQNIDFGLVVHPTSLGIAEGLSSRYDVYLNTPPATGRSVTVEITGASGTDVSVSPSTLTFTEDDWDDPQTVTVSTTADADEEDDHVTLTNTANGGGFDDVTATVAVTVLEDDDRGITVQPSSLTIDEGSDDTYTVVLDELPLGDVRVDLEVPDAAGFTVRPAYLTFTTANWDTAQTVTVTGPHDDDADNEQAAITHVATRGGYSGAPTAEVDVTITDDDEPGVTVNPTKLEVDEGGSETYTLVLDTKPDAGVTVTVTPPASSDITVDKATLTFTTDNWNVEQTVRVSAAHDNDPLDDTGNITHAVTSTDTAYDGITTDPVEVTVLDDEIIVLVSYGQAAYTVAESDNTSTTDVQENRVTVTVKLDVDPQRTITIPITAAGQNGADDDDYTGVPDELVFNEGETEKTFVFMARHDTEDDDGESVLLGFDTSDLPDNVSVGGTPTATVNIADDDDPQVTVRFDKASYTVPESDDSSTTEVAENKVEVKVVLSADPERKVTIPLVRTNQGGATDQDDPNPDYSGLPDEVVFNEGETQKTFTFTAEHDTVDDDGESVKLAFGSLPDRVSQGTPGETVVSIADDDRPSSLTVEFEQDSHTVAEGDTVTVRVTLSDDPETDVTIPITRTNQDGATDQDDPNPDYSGVPDEVVFTAGVTEKTFIFTAVNDTVDDDDESVKIAFGSLPTTPIAISAGDTDESVVNITDDDDPAVTVRFEQDSYTVAEGDGVTIKVILSADPERTVTIELNRANQGGATDQDDTGADYSGVPDEVVFSKGETQKQFTFTAADDTVDDDGEKVSLTFKSLPDRVSQGTPNEAVVNITDDDRPASLTVEFEQDSHTVAEGGTVTVKVILSDDPETDVTIPLTRSNQGGATDQDSADPDYSGVPETVTFSAGVTEKTFTFRAVNDTVDDDDESVKIAFGSLPTTPIAISAGTTDETVVSITDDDDPAVTVRFERDSYTVAEGDDATIKVILSADPERTVTIQLNRANQGGATDQDDTGADYSGVPDNVVFNKGETQKTFTFTAANDTIDDDDENVKLTFRNLPARVSRGSPGEAIVNIDDDDKPTSLTVEFEQDSYTVAEGSNITVKVILSDDPEQNVTIPLTPTNQDGATDADYSGVPDEVVFTSGQTEKTFTFTAINDTVDDDEESVKIVFGTLPTTPVAVTAGDPDETVVNITDDDVPAVTVSFEQGSYTVAESDDDGTTDAEENKVTVKVVLSADPERTVTIQLDRANQGGATDQDDTGADYSGVPDSVVFSKGETQKTFVFTAADDTIDDDDEKVKLTFRNLPTRVSEGSVKETVVNITDDDDPEISVSFEQGSYTVAESDDAGTTDVQENRVTVKVVLSADPERTVTIDIDRANQGGATDQDDTGADYSGVPDDVVFNKGETQKTFVFMAEHDTVDDDGENVKLTFVGLPDRVSGGSTDETVVHITDDDDPEISVSFEQSSYTVAESDNAATTEVQENKVTVKVVLSADPERKVTILIDPVNQDGATSADYSGVPDSVVFNRGETQKTFEFMARPDTVDDDDESVKLTFRDLPDRVSQGSTDETVVHITDDDDPEVSVSFEQSSHSVAESDDTGTTEVREDRVTVRVVLSADPERTVSIDIDRSNRDGATDQDDTGADYSGVPDSVTFTRGETVKSFVFMAEHDTVDDDGENVKLAFVGLPARVSRGSTDETVVHITDDDDPEVTVSFGAPSYTVAEGDAVEVTVTLSADPERTVVIDIDPVNQDGAEDADYSGIPESLTFQAGETEKSFTVNGFQDDVDDDDESVKLTFVNLPHRVTGGPTDEAVVNITDDDWPFIKVDFVEAMGSVQEGYNLRIKVVLDADPERDITIRIIPSEYDGATHHDYSVPGSVTFKKGETEAYPVFNAIDDSIDEEDERVTLMFGTPLPDRVTVGNPGITEVTITDDDGDGSPVVVEFVSNVVEINEGEEVEVSIRFSKPANDDVSIPLKVLHYQGLTDTDYSGVPGSVLVPRGDTEAHFTFASIQDDVVENDETAWIEFKNLPAAVQQGYNKFTAILVKDDDKVVQAFRTDCPSDSGERIILERVGNIGQSGERDFWRVELDPYRVYVIEVLGADGGIDLMGDDTHQGDLTLADPDLIAVWNADRTIRLSRYSLDVHDAGRGRNSVTVERQSVPGPFYIEIASGDGGTGTYQIKVRVNNVCEGGRYHWFGGPDGYVLDDAADTSTDRTLIVNPASDSHPQAQGGFLGDSWDWYWTEGKADESPDEDWYGVELTQGYEYTVELWTDSAYPLEHQATELKVLGIYDSNGDLVDGTASPGSGRSVSVTFRPADSGRYYVAVGSAGNDRTGVYEIRVVGRQIE